MKNENGDELNPFTDGVLEFTCMICGSWRLDKFISVHQEPIIFEGVSDIVPVGEHNIRYCNDKELCILYAKNYDKFKEMEKQIDKDMDDITE